MKIIRDRGGFWEMMGGWVYGLGLIDGDGWFFLGLGWVGLVYVFI